MKVTFTTTGIKALQRRVATRLDRVANADNVVRAMADDAMAQYARNVDSFTPGSVPDLSPAYKKTKQRKFGHVYPILKASGAMIASMYRRVYKLARGHYKVFIGFRGERNARLAAIHANGEGTSPQRDFLILPPSFTAKWTRRIINDSKKG